jgi:peptide/nickel transport system permease protein
VIQSVSAPGAASVKEARSRRAWHDHPWLKFLARRSLGILITLVILVVVTFFIVHLVPGDPARNVVGVNASGQEVARMRQQLGLDDPLSVQFGDYIWGLLRGNLGTSFTQHVAVSVIIGQRLPFTALLAACSLIVALGLGIPAGILAAAIDRRVSWFRGVFVAITSFGGALPEYVVGTGLVFIFGLTFKVLPTGEANGPTSIILPALAVGLGPAAVFARIVRNEVASIWTEEYMVVARAKRLPSRILYLRHILPNVVTSTLTLGGLLLVSLLGGTVIAENIFAWPGLGTEIVQAIEDSDYPTIQAVILMLGVLATAVNLIVDVALGLLDPRSLLGAR